VPIGVGLSSSAALEVATLRALRELLGLDLDDVEVARLAQRAEIEHAGVNCGILDQMASSLLEPGAMLFLDTLSLERRLLPLPAGAEVLVVDSGQSRSLASSKYNERRGECEAAARALGKTTLREVSDPAAVEALADPLRKRARHVIGENARVLDAVASSTAEAFGKLMNESHASLSGDYEVSTPVLDTLVGLLQADPAVFGAKLTGAGFGGACVALCRAGESVHAARRVLGQYNGMGHNGRLLVPA
jgi:galactokinase